MVYHVQNLFVSLIEFKILYQNKKTIIISYVIYKLQVYYHIFIRWYTARLQIAENPALLPPHWIAYKSHFKRFVTHTLPRQYLRPYCDKIDRIIAELSRAKRASGAPWVRKFGKLSIRENLVMT